MVCSLLKCNISNDVMPRLQKLWKEDYWVLVIGLNQCCAGIWIFKEPPVPRFFDVFKFRESLVLVLWKKKIRTKESSVAVISKTKKNLWFSWKNWQWSGNFMVGYLIFQKKLRIVVICQNWVFNFSRTIVMNPKNHHDNHWGLFLFLIITKHWLKHDMNMVTV